MLPGCRREQGRAIIAAVTDPFDRLPDVSVDYLMVADAAHAVGGKLYILGGGWTRLVLPPEGEPRLPFFVALGIVVPWHMTNTPFKLIVQIRDADGELMDEIASYESVERGRPAGLPAGSEQRVALAVPVTTMDLAPGRYTVVVLIDGYVARKTSFDAIRP